MKVYKRTKDGAWQINYRTEGKQKQIYLGINHTQASANRIGDVIRELLLCRYRDEIPGPSLLGKVRRLDSKVQATIRRHGLLNYCDTGISLGELIEQFIGFKEDLKPQSAQTLRTSLGTIREYFGPEFPASGITEDEAQKLKVFMLAEKSLAAVTVTARIGTCRSMFRYALRKRMIFENPFDNVVGGPDTNDDLFRYIERELIESVLSGCKDDDLNFGIRLGRYAGLRLPSEICYMKYSDFGKDGFFVHDETKTGRREVPFFRELRPHFERMKAEHPDEEYVFSRVSVRNANLRRRFMKRLERRGIERWPRLFNNLRASCVTEYDEMGFNEKTLDSIFGNTEQIRKRHYVGFRKDRAFMQILGTKNTVIDELIENGGRMDSIIETEKIDLMIRYLESLKVSQVSFEPEKAGAK